MFVSIVVPIYNCEKYLNRCIDSLLNQTYQESELLLIDDGSTDASGEICDYYANIDNRVKTYHKQNGGEATARNAGLKKANGDFVAFCDADDEYTPCAIEWLVSAICEDNVDLAVGAYLEKTGDITRFACTNQKRRSAEEAAIDIINDPSTYGVTYILSTVNGKLFKRSILSQNGITFDENWVIGNDTIFVNEYLCYCKDILDIFSPTYMYYKFEEKEQLQGMAWEYVDMFKLFLFKREAEITIAGLESNNAVFASVFNVLVSLLVRAAVYEDCFPHGLDAELIKLFDNEFAQKCVAAYSPVRLSDSKTIPQYFKEKNVIALLTELRGKAEKIHVKSSLVRLIYKGG